jgi:hypothetical protein
MEIALQHPSVNGEQNVVCRLLCTSRGLQAEVSSISLHLHHADKLAWLVCILGLNIHTIGTSQVKALVHNNVELFAHSRRCKGKHRHVGNGGAAGHVHTSCSSLLTNNCSR